MLALNFPVKERKGKKEKEYNGTKSQTDPRVNAFYVDNIHQATLVFFLLQMMSRFVLTHGDI